MHKKFIFNFFQSIMNKSHKEKKLKCIKRDHILEGPKTSLKMSDYLQTISELVNIKGYASPKNISECMNVTPAGVTKMLRKLHKEGYIEYTKYTGLRLNPKGKKISWHAQQNQKYLIEFFQMIGIDDVNIRKDVRNIEYHFNKKTLVALSKFVKFLKSEPHLLDKYKKQQKIENFRKSKVTPC